MAKWKGTGLKSASSFPWIHVCCLAKSILYTFYKNKHHFKYISEGRDPVLLIMMPRICTPKNVISLPHFKVLSQLFFGAEELECSRRVQLCIMITADRHLNIELTLYTVRQTAVSYSKAGIKYTDSTGVSTSSNLDLGRMHRKLAQNTGKQFSEAFQTGLLRLRRGVCKRD